VRKRATTISTRYRDEGADLILAASVPEPVKTEEKMDNGSQRPVK
jgi:hypothetical protein